MKHIYLLICMLFYGVNSTAQEIFTRGLVYQSPVMKKVVVKEGNVFRKANDTTLTFDIYYPPAFSFKKDLPVVVFNNGAGGMDLPRWGIYKDWAKLAAAYGMIAVNHQTRNGRAFEDGEALLDCLIKNAKKLNVDPGKIGLWTSSANARTGMRLAYNTKPGNIKALVVYYGGPDSLGQLRQNLPTLVVRAGLDAQFINTGIDNFVQSALQQDAQIELINYVKGIHAFDAFTHTDESKKIIVRTIEFLKKNLFAPVIGNDFVLTNKNFMWLVMNNQLPTALAEFRKARTKYRADSSFQPFYNAAIREDVLNANAYWLMNHQRQQEALEVFKLSVESYPESPNANESLSEAYELTGSKAEAIRYAELCLQKLPAASGISENFKQVIKHSAEQRLVRLGGNGSAQVLPPKRAHHELVYDETDNTILLSAGSTPLNGGGAFAFYNDLWKFDGTKWKAIGIAGNQRSGIRMAYNSKRKQLFSFGGFANNNSLADLRVYENGEWKTLSNDTAMKSAEPGFVYDTDRDKLIAFGGSGRRGLVNGITWEWDGSAWKKVEGTGPEGRQGFVMVYDSKRKKTVVFGGMDGAGKSFNDDVWEFDGVHWQKITGKANGPGPRLAAGATYDSRSGMVLIFGGISNQITKGDTWGWNGIEWKKLADSGPAPRTMGYMAYDKIRDRTVLFGGRLGWPNDVNDTWEWDGVEWKEKKIIKVEELNIDGLK